MSIIKRQKVGGIRFIHVRIFGKVWVFSMCQSRKGFIYA